ncbi:MAG: ISKra4 family transposase [Pseudonocardiaceae bacterium]
MKLTVQLVLHADDDTETIVREVFTLQREDPLAPETLGLQLAEAKDLLVAVQDTLVVEQVATAVSAQVGCPDCGAPRRHKDSRPIVMKTLFGRLRLDSPRWWHCGCQPRTNHTFSPLDSILPERTTPELSYLQARFAGLVSYGLSADLLGELLPLGRALHANTVRRGVQATAQRLEDELGDERFSFIDTCQLDREELPRPDLPLTVGLDGGYVHSAAQRSRRDGWFEVIAGKAVPAQGRASCFGYVQTYDTKPKRRLVEVLKAQGMAANQQVTFLTDGGEDIRDVPCYLNPQADHLLDWFHITMRITVMTNMAKSLQPPPPDPDLELSAETATKLIGEVSEDLGRLKWFLWHGNVFRALQTVEGIAIDLETLHHDGQPSKLLKAVHEFDSYLRANAGRIPNYGERRRAGEAISTAFTESTVNQVISKRMVKKQQMRWTPRGAHLLLQIRTRVLNDTLTNDYRRWYPGLTHTSEADTLDDQLVAA